MSWLSDTADSASTGGNPFGGGTVGNILTGGYQNTSRGLSGGKFGKKWGGLKEDLGFSNQAGIDKSNEIRAGIGTEYDALEGKNTEMKGVGANYLKSIGDAENAYQGEISGLRKQASDQATSAQATYDNNIKPGLVNAVEQSQKELYDANGNPKYMTYLQAQDPNNAVAKSFRGFYDTQAQNEGKAGLADVGIMQNMGAQAMANQMGGMAGAPMTGAQMQMMQGQNMAQSGQAMANVQRRQQDLRDQGTQQGWLQTQAAYERGESARDRQMKNLSSLQQGQGQNIQQQSGLRGEQGGYSADMVNSKGRVAEGTSNVNMGNLQRDAGLISGRAGAIRGMDVGDLQGINASQAGKMGAISGIVGSAGGLLGSFIGGGAGAQAGANASGGGFGSMYSQQGTAPQYGNGAGNPAAGSVMQSMYGGGQQQQPQPAALNGGTNQGVMPQQGTNVGYNGNQYDPNAQSGGIGKVAGLMSMFA